jgi:sulfite exporter TauE/SafE
MQINEFTLLGGVLLGLASSLHCAAMCGGIASGVVFLFDPKRPWDRARVLMSAQAGRIAAYVIAGAILGATGASLYGLFDHAAAYRLLQWAGAVTLMWIGLSVAGVLPSLSALDRRVAALSSALSSGLAPFRRYAVAGPFAAGLAWGTIPCPMVYAALFTAMLTGSGAGGATLMAGFGLGTLPAVTATAFGVTALARVEARAFARGLIGLSIAVLGFSTVYPSSPTAGLLCLAP